MASNDLQEAELDQFMAVTGVDRERATFFLQSAAWNLQAAFGAFYDDNPPAEEGMSTPVQESQPPLRSERIPPPGTDNEASSSKSFPSRSEPQGGFATLSDYRQDRPKTSDEDAQQFYAGGSEHSGQMIEGPPRKKPNPQNLAKEVFEAAKKQGAVSVEEEEKELAKQRSAAFQGTGFRLGDNEGPSVMVGKKLPPQPEEAKVRRTLRFWQNGFSVDDGPLRTGETDEDKRFIASVSKGEVPQELIRDARGGEVDIDIEDKRTEPYVKPKPKLVAFSGAGHKLGSLAPQVVQSATPQHESSVDSNPPAPSVPLNPDLPTTSVQIRLADGTRLVSKFNHTHTVNDIRQFINLSCPTMSAVHYVLMTTFPNKELTDPTQTLADAKLLNAVIVQRMK